MTPSFPLAPALIACAALALVACDRGAEPGAGSARNTGTTVQAPPPSATASAPMTPSGMTNPSTASQAGDLSNSTRASGTTNVYQPPSPDNPPPGGTPVGSAGDPASAAGQTVTSQTKGTSPPPNSGTLPGGVEGNSGTAQGGGKQ